MNGFKSARHAKKLAALKEELLQWQQFVVQQEQRLDRAECTISALIATLNAQGRVSRFSVKRLNAEIDRVLKARREALKKQQEARSAKTKANGEDHSHDSVSSPA